MTLLLDGLAGSIRASRGLAGKRDIDAAVRALGLAGSAVRVGDDCAAIPDRDGFLLFAMEGFINGFVAAEPWFAGYCGVMVNLSDVAAMGGRPIAVVDALWSDGEAGAAPLLAGLRAGAEAYGVPIVGGHTNLRSDGLGLAVAVLGRAERLLTSFDARPGDDLVMAVDLREGRYTGLGQNWNASVGAPSARLRADLDILPDIAEAGLSLAAKDISMAGTIGTAAMLMECSGVGGVIDVCAVPKPESVPLERWLASFPSYGYLLGVAPDKTPAVIDRFRRRDIAAARIGLLDGSRRLRITEGSSEALVWDFADSALIGCGAAAGPRPLGRDA